VEDRETHRSWSLAVTRPSSLYCFAFLLNTAFMLDLALSTSRSISEVNRGVSGSWDLRNAQGLGLGCPAAGARKMFQKGKAVVRGGVILGGYAARGLSQAVGICCERAHGQRCVSGCGCFAAEHTLEHSEPSKLQRGVHHTAAYTGQRQTSWVLRGRGQG